MGRPASLLFGDEKVRDLAFELFVSEYASLCFGIYLMFSCFSVQVRVFYAVRFFLGLLSVIADTCLVIALSKKYGKRLASYTLAMLCLTSGCFFASTS